VLGLEFRLYPIQWNALSATPRTRDEDILEAFPQAAMFSQVDLYGYFTALLVGQVMNPGHVLILP
jgi:hypothetical protein